MRHGMTIALVALDGLRQRRVRGEKRAPIPAAATERGVGRFYTAMGIALSQVRFSYDKALDHRLPDLN